VHSSTTDPLGPGEGQDTTSLRLVVVAGPSTGAELLLERGTYRVGKQTGNELVLKDSTVSRCHLVIEVLGSWIRLVDNGSRNGTFFKGRRFESMEAGPGTMKARSDAWAQRRVPDVLASPADKLRDACIPPAFEGAVPANLSGQIAALMKQPQVTVAVVQLRSLAEPGGVLDDLVAAGFDVSGPKWKR